MDGPTAHPLRRSVTIAPPDPRRVIFDGIGPADMRVVVTLTDDAIEKVARRVVELLKEDQHADNG